MKRREFLVKTAGAVGAAWLSRGVTSELFADSAPLKVKATDTVTTRAYRNSDQSAGDGNWNRRVGAPLESDRARSEGPVRVVAEWLRQWIAFLRRR